MNKKTSFLIIFFYLSVVPLVVFASASPTLDEKMERIIGVVETIGTALVVIGWMITGVLFVLAQGAPDKLNTAKKALFACVIGTIAIVLAIFGDVINMIKSAIGV